jgi:PPP family 3-phenylpropionic acid transporter
MEKSSRQATHPSALQLGVLNAMIIAPVGVQLPFMPLWYASLGFSAPDVAAIQAATPIARVISNMIAPVVADRTGKPSWVIVACALGMAAAAFFLGFTQSYLLVFIGMTAFAFAQGPTFPIADSMILRETRRRILARAEPLDYGLVRGAGSLSVLALMIAGGWIVSALPASATPWLLGAVALAIAPATLWLAPKENLRLTNNGASKPPPVARPWLLGLTIALAALIQASHGMLYAFGSIAFKKLGYGDGVIGLLWATSVGAEVAFFMVAAKKFGAAKRAYAFMGFGAAIATLRWIATAYAMSAPALFGLQMLHAGSFAASHIGAVYAVAMLAGEPRRAQAQGWLAAAVGLTTGAVTFVSGHLWARFEQTSFIAMAFLSAAAVIGAVFASELARRGEQPQTRLF